MQGSDPKSAQAIKLHECRRILQAIGVTASAAVLMHHGFCFPPGQVFFMKQCMHLILFATILGAWGMSTVAWSKSLEPGRHGDFAHYTFALTWQPGYCATDEGCVTGQPTDVLIGLHGLWASRPRGLIERGVSAPQWWRGGCDFYHHSGSAPPLSAATREALMRVMPHLHDSLLTHEYDKHVQCFGFDAETFFRTELQLRARIVDSDFGRYLMTEARGHRVERRRVMTEFMRSFATQDRRALQLRCGKDRRGRPVLTQLWITFHANAVGAFPGPRALMDAPIPQANCPAVFQVPDWPSGSGSAGSGSSIVGNERSGRHA
jgi:ribonuclease I (enterobacter ribonuclease)